MTINDVKYLVRTKYLKPIVPAYHTVRRYIRGLYYAGNFTIGGGYFRDTFFFIIDPHYKHPGMADRIKAIVYCYNVCKRDGLDFKIIYKTPFSLEDYLCPNLIDWRADMSDLHYELGRTRFVSEIGKKYIKTLRKGYEYHCFNYDGDKLPVRFEDTGYYWYDLFEELFKPCPDLKQMIDSQPFRSQSYVAVHLRFVNALEKFEEGYCNGIKSDAERQVLISRCHKGIINICKENEGKEVLVFSDSKTFLDSLSDLPVKTLDNQDIGHICFDNSRQTILKTFLDMYMISRASKVYRIGAPELFASSCFALCSARMGGKEFYSIDV